MPEEKPSKVRSTRPAQLFDLSHLDSTALDAIKQRFMARVVVQPDGHWRWIARTDGHGYGEFCVGRKYHTTAQRWSHALFKGPIPAGMEVHHKCRNRWCVNPVCLELLTRRENQLEPDSQSFSAINARKTECPKGHPYTPENTRVYMRIRKNGLRSPMRRCLICERVTKKQYHERKLSALAVAQLP